MKTRLLFLAVLLFLAAMAGGYAYWWYGGLDQTGAATPATFQIVRHDNLVYFLGAGADLEKNSLAVLAPEGQVRAPVAILLHGGGWTSGYRQEAPLVQNAEWLAARGVLAVPLDYRLVPAVPPTEQPWDVAHGIDWVFRHIDEYGGDPERIVLVGHSAGGHLAALVTADRRYLDELGVPASVPAGVIALAGMFDLRDDPNRLTRINRKIADETFGTDPARRAAISPVVFARPGMPPFLLLRGRGDHLVRREQNEALVEALRRAGDPVEVLDIKGRTHKTLFDHLNVSGDIAGEAVLRFIREIKPRPVAAPPPAE
ncbi:MAG: alpha/beta hydrolase [Myxococcales bacterium]|nr:alpha/beta hydrolase [Myxococcales bacterium]